MFGGISEATLPAWATLVRDLGAAFLTGLAVKIMDDFLDAPLDQCRGLRTVAQRLGTASLPYALAAVAAGAALNHRWAISLFLASYALGMAVNLGRQLPTGLLGYQEALVALGACLVLYGPVRTVAAVAIVTAIQITDDLVDWREDRLAGGGVITRKLDRFETLLALAISGGVAILVDFRMAVAAWVAAGAVLVVMPKGTIRKDVVRKDAIRNRRGSPG